jgi:hypothetical protein
LEKRANAFARIGMQEAASRALVCELMGVCRCAIDLLMKPPAHAADPQSVRGIHNAGWQVAFFASTTDRAATQLDVVELVNNASYNYASIDGGTHVLTDDLGDHVGLVEAPLVCRGNPYCPIIRSTPVTLLRGNRS